MRPANRVSPGNLSCHMKFFSPVYHVISVYMSISFFPFSGFLPNQGNQGNIREFYFDLKYQGKIREKRKEIGNQGKIREIFPFAHYLQKILRIVFNFFNHII